MIYDNIKKEWIAKTILSSQLKNPAGKTHANQAVAIHAVKKKARIRTKSHVFARQ